MTARMLILHTPLGLEEASGLVDLVEASLPLSAGDIACSSLPGYTLGAAAKPADYLARVDDVSIAIVLVDEPALQDAQLWFEAAVIWARGKRMVLLLDRPERLSEIPPQLIDLQAILREDRPALVALIEDLAYALQVRPRFGRDAIRALDQLDRAPPSQAPEEALANLFDSLPPEADEGFADHEDTEQSAPPVAALPAVSIAAPSYEDEPIELDDEDVMALSEPPPEARPSHFAPRLRCSVAFEAGRAISECSFHRKGGEDFRGELADPFGRFVDAVGGDWDQLSRISDIEVWLSAIDNLLEALPEAQRAMAEWYEIGFQFSTLRSIAEQGLPDEMEQRAVYQEMWMQSLTQFRASATQVGVTPRDIRRLQSQLENLLGPMHKRDHASTARVLGQLRLIVETRDEQEPTQEGQVFG